MARASVAPKIRARALAPETRRLTRDLDRYWPAMYRRLEPGLARVVAASIPKAKADPGLVDEVAIRLRTLAWDQETRILSRVVTPVVTNLAGLGFESVSRELGTTVSFDLSARPVRAIIGDVGTRITQVTTTSQGRIARMIADGVEKGLSVEQIVRGVRPGTTNIRGPVPAFPGIRGLVDSWGSTGVAPRLGPGTSPTGSRSYLIALTETGNAYNRSALAAYESTGFVDVVEVFDGQDCGWSTHDDPSLAHGSVRKLAEANAHPLAHPRCQRAFGARADAKGPSASPYQSTRGQNSAVPGATPGIGAVDPLDAEAVSHSGFGTAPRPSPATARASQLQWERSRVAEPGISASLRGVTDGRMVTFDQAMAEVPAAPGGDLAGYAARRKTLTSLSRKIDAEIVDAAKDGRGTISSAQAVDALGDTVRYTVRFQPGEYAAGQRQVVDKLLAGGNRPLKWKVKWDDSIDPAYRGINSNWISPNGTVFEVQIHTPRSFFVKEANHPLYEEARKVGTSVARRAELNAQMNKLAKTADFASSPSLTYNEVIALGRSGPLPQTTTYLEARTAAEARIRTTVTHETAVVQDRTGRILFEKADPTQPRGVNFTPAELAQMPGAHLTHNHPGAYQYGLSWASSLSSNDVSLLLTERLLSVRAIGKGAAYEMQFTESATLSREIAAKLLAADLKRLDAEVRRDFVSRIRQGKIDALERTGSLFEAGRVEKELSIIAERDHWHEVWTRFVVLHPEFRYSRVLDGVP